MSDELQVQILLQLSRHELNRSPYYLLDDALAAAIGKSIAEVRTQLEILGEEDYVRLSVPATGKWGARLTSKGKQLFEPQ